MEEINLSQQTILITGAHGFLGSHTVEKFRAHGANNIITFSQKEYDLRKEHDVQKLFKRYSDIDIVVHIAADVGGIKYSSTHPGQQYYNNIMMNTLILHYSYLNKVKKFVGIGSVCEYPEVTPIPFKESYLWNGYPVPSNDAYGLSKRSLLAHSIAYHKEFGFNAIHLLPINLYGPRDDFSLENSHVIPALIIKFYDAYHNKKPTVEVWGSGKASREFIYVEDCAEAIVLATKRYNKPEPVNLGTGDEITIQQLAEMIAEMINYQGQIVFNTSQPEGQLRRKLDVSKAAQEFGFTAPTSFKEGLKKTIRWYRETYLKSKTP
ncbi:MAG: GDP-L-fucose synthase [Candidatus Thermoplasmatota archaeon]